MANGTSAFATAYDAATTSRVGGPNIAEYDYSIRMTSRPIVILGTESHVTTDYHDLGPALQEMVIIPDLCRVRWKTGAVTTLSTTATLKSYSTDGTVTSLTGLATLTGLTVADLFLDFAAATTAPVVAATDRFRLYFTTVTTITATEAGSAADVEIFYRPNHR